MRGHLIAILATTAMTVTSGIGCVPRARMCTASTECADKSACVAGRCQVDKTSVKPAIDSARRLVVHPIDIAYLQSGDGPSNGALPSVFALGKDGGKLFLKFSVPLAPNTNVIEAYVVLRRSTVVDDDPEPVSLHATRIVESWEGGSMSWARQPRSAEMRLPSTTVEPAGSGLIRLDVRELVRQWGRHDKTDQGIAVVAENETRTGTTFALSGGGAPAPDVEPFLELYVR